MLHWYNNLVSSELTVFPAAKGPLYIELRIQVPPYIGNRWSKVSIWYDCGYVVNICLAMYLWEEECIDVVLQAMLDCRCISFEIFPQFCEGAGGLSYECPWRQILYKCSEQELQSMAV